MNWLDLRKIYERSKHREKRKKELRNEVERRFPHLSNRKYVIALAGDRKVEWRPDFIKRTGGSKADMQFECYDIVRIPERSGHLFQKYPATHSDFIRPLIPEHPATL